MTDWVILVDKPGDFPARDTPHKVITTSEYISRPRLFERSRPTILNLSRSCAYRSKGYYASLIALARQHHILPGVETILELRKTRMSGRALSELNEELNRSARDVDFRSGATTKLLVCFGLASVSGLERFGRLLFDRFACPALEVTISRGQRLTIDRVRPRNIARLSGGDAAFFLEALRHHTRRDPTARRIAKYDLAVLFDPDDRMPPSSADSIRHFARIAGRLSVNVEPVTGRQLAKLAEYDGLFIRETTSIDNHTWQFARRAWQQGMPVIDDPVSIIRCTNKVFLMELLNASQVPTPPTMSLLKGGDLNRPAEALGLPLVVKIPDGSFSRGIYKVNTLTDFRRITDGLFEDSDVILAQKFLPTKFDWRVGILAGEPLFVCQYSMARGHWQVVKHRPNGSWHEGGFRVLDLDAAPREVIEIALRAAAPVGDGFYGVDLKETATGIVVMEGNDNPNLEHGIEDAAGKDEIWIRLLQWFTERFERRSRHEVRTVA